MARPKAEETTQPKIILKHSREFRHDLFKLEVSKMKKNTSWKKFEPIITELEHAHIFHSHNNRGEIQKYCTPVGGHFHEVKTSLMPDGSITAECGPPMREVVRKTRTGKLQKVIEQVAFLGDTESKTVTDTHSHTVAYQDSEYLSTEKIKRIRDSNHEALSHIPQPQMKEVKQTSDVKFEDVSVD